MANWKLKKEENISDLLETGINPIVLKLLKNRGIAKAEDIRNFLNPDYDKILHDPFLFPDMKKAVSRIESALKKKEKILIYGDYDADGVTSAVVLMDTLREIGIDPMVYIPDKKKEGYGLNKDALDKFREEGVGLIITVDCGITNYEEIVLANKYGIDVIVVDHHNVPKKMPPALAIINPKYEKSGYPFRELAGVGVVFKLVQAIYESFMPEKKEQTKWLLDLVSLGTVADCVPLHDENRVIVKYGMLVLSKTRRVGLQELFSVGRIQIDENNVPETRKIAFQVAPRINSAGRMNHANAAYNLLIETDRVKARDLALELEESNSQRQKETGEVCAAVRALANKKFKEKKLIFAVDEHYPIGIAGLVAGKIADEFEKPTVILQKENGYSRGSLRSIPQLNIYKILENCSDCLVKFGGHSQAAGITVANDKIEEFYRKMSELVEKELQGKNSVAQIEVDLELSAKDIDFEIAGEIEKLGPFGEGNKEPVFLMKNLKVSGVKNVGNDGKHLKMQLEAADGTPKIFESIAFNMSKIYQAKAGDIVDLVFSLKLDRWNNSKKLLFNIIDFKSS